MEEGKKGNAGVILCIVILLLACVGMGIFIFINRDKLIVKDSIKTETKNNKITEEETNKKESASEETNKKEATTNDDGKYTEKVYSWDEDTIILFKSGSCLVKSNLEYTAHCKYEIENNTINLTRYATGPNNGTEQTYTYNVVIDGVDEYIELSTDNSKRYKYLKEYK